MDLRLEFVYLPVKDLKTAVTFYRDTLGFAEAWREGDLTCAFELPGTEVQLMLIEDTAPDARPGPIFLTEDAKEFYKSNLGALSFENEPAEIPPGFVTAFTDPSGNVLSVMDVSKERG